VLPASPHFDPAAMLELLTGARVNNTWMVPTQIVMLADHLAGSAASLPDLEAIVYGGAPFPESELRKALEVLGPILVQLYAQGETPMTATVLPAADHARIVAEGRDQLASAGFARPGMDVRVLDGDDLEAPVGEIGEVCVRGPAVMLGYWEREEATAEALRNGWLHTGDLGRMDEQGYIFLMDRAKDMIITGGSNVYAVEVEAVLAVQRGVREVAVIGLADRTWGEIVTAVIVAEPGVDLDLKVLAASCEELLASYKRPRRWVTLEALPRNAYGKVLKRELRESLA
jgi:long-chain acyl-CoA synthetase